MALSSWLQELKSMVGRLEYWDKQYEKKEKGAIYQNNRAMLLSKIKGLQVKINKHGGMGQEITTVSNGEVIASYFSVTDEEAMALFRFHNKSQTAFIVGRRTLGVATIIKSNEGS